MAEERPTLPPPPPLTDNNSTGIAQDASAEPRPVKSRSLFDFFGKKGPSAVAGEVERDSGNARTSSKDREIANQSFKTFQPEQAAAPPDGDTSANSITIVEPTGSKRKAAPTTTGGRKRAQGKKVTDEDAELRAMEAAARKGLKAAAKVAGKKGREGVMDVDGGIAGNAVGESGVWYP
jgi:hypothetical protein